MAAAPQHETSAMTVAAQNEIVLNPNIPREREIILIEREFAFMQRRARMFAESDIVPVRYQGKIANCLIAMEIAKRMNTGEMQIMQSLYVVHGTPAFDAKYMIALINTSGILTGRLKFVFSGGTDKNADGYGCHAEGTEQSTGEKLIGPKIDMTMVKAELWIKNGKWTTMRDLMFMYRAAAFWCRTNTPELLLGMRTLDEAEDIVIAERDITPVSAPVSSVQEMLAAKKSEPITIDGEQPLSADIPAEDIVRSANDIEGVLQNDLAPLAPVTMKDVQHSLESAATRAELDEAADLIREVKNPTHRDLLNGIYEKRSAELQ